MAITEADLIEYGQRQREYRRKRRYPIHIGMPWEGNGVTLQEVIEQATRLYPDLILNPVTARKWTERGLLPTPDVHHRGGTEGNRAHYPVDATAQVAAAGYLQAQGFRQKQIAQARRVVLEGVPVADDLMSDVVRILTNNISPDFIPSKGALELAGAIQRYSLALAMARGGRVVSKPWGHLVGIAHGTDTAGRPTFAYYASIPGLYWDPRIEGKQPDIALDLDQQIRAQRAALRDRNGAS